MTELKRYTFDEIAMNLPPKEMRFYIATEADRKMLELLLELWNAMAERARRAKSFTDQLFAQNWIKFEEECRKKAEEIRKKLEELK